MSLYNDASLVMIPSAYKDGKLYSIKPTDGSGDFTFSRGSNLAATRVDENGLIEKGRENLLLQSNQFDTTWTNTNTTETGGQTGYDGSSDAWLLSKSAANARIEQSISQSGVQTFSVYAKQGNSDWIGLVFMGGSNPRVYFDLTNGTSGSLTGGAIVKDIQSVGNGWYRCFVTCNDTITSVRLYPAEGDGVVIGTSGSVYIQDAQLEAGLVATDYIETTTTTAQAGILEDMPRLDYSGGASCPSLLLEPQRTNLVTNTEYVSSSDYVVANWTGTITNNTNETLSPEGVYNAIKFVKSGASDRVYFQTSVSDGTYTGSMYFKAVSGQEGNTIEISVKRFGGGSGSTTKLITLTSEWQRVDVTATLSGGTNTAIYIADFSSSGNATSFYCYGAMLEVGSYPTSYIPCYGAATTRSGDTNVSALSSGVVNQEQGTLFLEIKDFEWTQSALRLIGLSDGTYANRIIVLTGQSANTLRIIVTTNNALQASVTSGNFNGNVKLAYAYSSDGSVLYANGSQVLTSAAITLPTISNLYIGADESGGVGLQPNGTISQSAYFPTRLINTELAALTTI